MQAGVSDNCYLPNVSELQVCKKHLIIVDVDRQLPLEQSHSNFGCYVVCGV
jgi:hypothetical protein